MTPWRLIIRFTALQALIVTGILLIGARASAREILLGLLLSVPASIWFGRALYAPLARLASRVRSGELGTDPKSATESADHEWAELERALTRLQSDMKGKDLQILRDREELASIMASVSNAIVALDREGRLLFCNTRFSELFGKFPLGADAPVITDVIREPDVIETFQICLGSGARQSSEVILSLKAQSQPLHFSISATPLRKTGSESEGVVLAFQDVTELKRSERVRTDFVANVSHELRTPLTSIRGYTATLIEDAKSGRWDAAPQFLQVIARNADRLLALVEDLLDLSSIENGVKLDKSWIKTEEVTNTVLAQLEPKLKAKGLETKVSFEATEVLADPRRIEQVLLNLTDNAAKYTPEGGRIHIRWNRFSMENETSVRLEVEDNGPGIPPNSLARVFERFYRVDPARSRDAGGTGLGLAIVKHLVTRHGGQVSVESTLNKGSTFRCTFPTS